MFLKYKTLKKYYFCHGFKIDKSCWRERIKRITSCLKERTTFIVKSTRYTAFYKANLI